MSQLLQIPSFFCQLRYLNKPLLHPPSFILCWHRVTMGRLATFTQKIFFCAHLGTWRMKDMHLFQHIIVYSASPAEPRCLEVGIVGTINELKANSQILEQAHTVSHGACRKTLQQDTHGSSFCSIWESNISHFNPLLHCEWLDSWWHSVTLHKHGMAYQQGRAEWPPRGRWQWFW